MAVCELCLGGIVTDDSRRDSDVMSWKRCWKCNPQKDKEQDDETDLATG